MGWDDIKDMPATNLREELLALLAKEAEYAHPCPPPADGSSSGEDSRSAAIRQQVCQWNYEWVDHFLVSREVVHLSMHYFDRFLVARRGEGGRGIEGGAPPLSEELSHLLALASLYVACKRQGAAAAIQSPGDEDGGLSDERASARFCIQDFCDLSGGTYGQRMIEGMELSLLGALRWRLHPPTPSEFLTRYAKLLSLSMEDIHDDDDHRCRQEDLQTGHHGGGWSVFELARYQIELATYSPELCHACPPSAVALAALLNAMDSRPVRTDRTAAPSRIRGSFLHRLQFVGGGFGEDAMAASVQQARIALKTLCPETIVLPGQEEALSSLEYELPKDQLLADLSTSPVGVESDRL